MATPATALKLLEELREASYSTAAQELKDLRTFAASQVRRPAVCSPLPPPLPGLPAAIWGSVRRGTLLGCLAALLWGLLQERSCETLVVRRTSRGRS
jgi:hypothetical protein